MNSDQKRRQGVLSRLVAVAVATSLFISGCSKRDAVPGPIPVPDNSLPIEVYLAKGLPAPDREWLGSDYGRAAKVLALVASQDATQLPRRDSAVSGGVFARLCDTRNLAILQNRNLPVDQRLPMALDFLQASRELMVLYAAVSYKPGGKSFDAEIVELASFLLAQTAILFPLADEFLAALPPDDSRMAVRKEGYQKARSGFTTMVAGSLEILSERQIFRDQERIRLAGRLGAILPGIMGYLPAQSQVEFRLRIKELAGKEPHAEVQAALKKLFEAVAPQ